MPPSFEAAAYFFERKRFVVKKTTCGAGGVNVFSYVKQEIKVFRFSWGNDWLEWRFPPNRCIYSLREDDKPNRNKWRR